MASQPLGRPGSLRASGIRTRSDSDSIAWAMVPYNTTRAGDIPGGLGSKVLRDFVELNRGRLLIASAGGFWCQKGSVVSKIQLPNQYPGTAVILEINTSDKNSYDLASGPNPAEIW